MIVDVAGVIAYCSDAAGSILGYRPASLTGTSGFALVHPDDRAVARKFLAQALRHQGTRAPIDVRARHADGAWLVVESWATDLRAEAGIGGIVVNFRDVTAQRASEVALRQLSGRLLQMQDEERRRIARDLHDGLAQDLLALGFNLEQMQRRGMAADTETRHLLAESEALVQKTMREIRTLSYLLHPPLLEEAGLAAALRWFVDGFVVRSGIAVEFGEQTEIGRLPRDVEIALFRVAQESLTNVHRHSASKTATIRLRRGRAGVVLQIRDRGRGVRPVATPGAASGVEPSTPGVGIAGMRERLRQLGGTLDVSSSRAGTTITARVPIAGDRR
jgi:PAS domain S-box-containing protein